MAFFQSRKKDLIQTLETGSWRGEADRDELLERLSAPGATAPCCGWRSRP